MKVNSWTLFTFIMLLTTGCVSSSYHRHRDVPTGMNRVTVVKNDSGKVSRTIEPITLRPYSEGNSSFSMINDGPYLNLFSKDSYSRDEMINSDDGSDVEEVKWGSGLDSVGFEAGIVNTRLWHSFTTDFQSSSFDNIKWNPNPRISGLGGDVNLYFEDDKGVAFSLGVGGFQSKSITNSQVQNSFYASEQTTTDAFWMDAGIRSRPSRWIYLQGLIGLLFYEVSTEIKTNVPAYIYEGLSGQRGLAFAGVGGGLETPWEFPVHLFTGVRVLVPISEDATYESVLGQLNGGLLLRF